MTLFELFDSKMNEINQVGELAIEQARRDGVPAYYVEPSLGPGIVRELPDGSRERIERRNGTRIVVERYGPKA